METFWTSGIVVLAVINVIFLILLLTFARELGIILVRLGPGHARQLLSGPKIGDVVEPTKIVDVVGITHQIEPSKSHGHLLLFISPGCPSCSNLVPAMRTLSRDYAERVSTYVISSGNGTAQDIEYARLLRRRMPYVCDIDLHAQFGIDATPYAVLLDSDNRVVNKGIVNNLEHLESLMALELHVLRDVASAPLAIQGNAAGASDGSERAKSHA